MMSLPPVIEMNGQRYAAVEGDAMPSEFSKMNARDQARFFNDLGAIVSLWETYSHGEIQWCSMVPELDDNGRAVLRSMSQFLDT